MNDRDNDDSSPSSYEEEASSDVSDAEGEKTVHLKDDLSQVPFCELVELKNKVGFKRYNEAINGYLKQRHDKQKLPKVKNKNSPLELSSKKPPPRFRKVIPVKKKLSRDPRFDELSGTFNEDKFEKAYAFIDDIKANEKKQLKKEIKKTKNSERTKELDSLLKRMEQQEAAKKSAATKRQAEKERKKAELELIKQGKRPFYLKKSEKRKLELAEKFKELKSSGKLEKYLKKRGKKNVSKERKNMPQRRGLDA